MPNARRVVLLEADTINRFSTERILRREDYWVFATDEASAAMRVSAVSAIDLVLETIQALFEERGDEEKVWGSMVKQAIKRRKPGFNERYHGFRSFGEMLEEAETRKLLQLQRDEKSGGYVITGVG